MSRVLEQLAKRAVSLAMYCTAHATSTTNIGKFDVLCEESNTNVLVKGKLFCAKDAHHYLSMTCNVLCKLAKESSRAGQTMQVHKSNFYSNNTSANTLTDHNVHKECETHEILHSSAILCLRQLESCIKALPPDYELPTETILYIISIIRYATSHKSENSENINNNMKEATESKGKNNALNSLVISQCELEELLMQVNAHVSMFSLHQWKPTWLFHGIHAIARINPVTHPPMLSDMCAAISSHLSSISPAASATLLWSLAKLHLERSQRELWSLVCQRCRNVYRSMNEVSQLTLTYALLLANDCTCTAQERLLQLSYETLQECNGAHNHHNISMSNNNNNSSYNYNSYNDISVNEGRNNAESNTFFNNRQSLQSIEHNDDVHNNNNNIIASDVANVNNTSSTRVTIRDLLKRQSYGAIKLHLLANTHAMSTEVLLDLMTSVLTNICQDNHSHSTRSHTFRKANILEKDMELARNVRNWQNEIALIFLGQETYEKYALTSKQNAANHEDEFHQLEYILSQICQKSLNERSATQLLSLSLTAHTIYKSCHRFSHASHTNHSNLSMLLEKVAYRTTMYLLTLPVSQLKDVHTVLHLITQVWVEFGTALFHKRRSGQIRNNAENNSSVNRQKSQYNNNIQSDVPCIDYAECQDKMSELLLESLKRITTRVERKIEVGMLWSLLISWDLLQLTGYNTHSINRQEQHKSIEEIEELRKANKSSRSSNTMTVVKNNLEHVQPPLSKLVETWLIQVKKQNINGNNLNSKSSQSNTSCIYKLTELIPCAMEINLCSFSKQCDRNNENSGTTTLRTSEGAASMMLSFTLLDKVIQLLTETYLPSCTDVNVLIYVLQCTSFTLDYEEQQQQQESIEFYQKLRQVQEIVTRQLEHCPVNKHTLDAITACLLCHKTNRQPTIEGEYNDNSGHPVVCSNNNNDDYEENKLVDKSEKSINRLRSVLSSSSSFSVGNYSHRTQSLLSLTKGEMIISDQLLDLYIRLVVHHATTHNNKIHHNSGNVINADYLTVLLMCCEQREYSVNALEQFYKMLLTRRFGQTQSFIDCVPLPVYALVQLITSALLLCHLHSGMAVGVLSTLMTQLTRYGVAQCRTIAELNSVAPLLSLPIIEQLKLKTSLATATVECAESILQERKLGRGEHYDKRNDESNNSDKSEHNESCGENKKDALMKLLSYTDTPLEKGYFIAYLIRAEVNVPESLLELLRAETAFMTPNITNSEHNNEKVSRNNNLKKENRESSLEEPQKEEDVNSDNANDENDVDDLLCEGSARRTKTAHMYASLSEYNK